MVNKVSATRRIPAPAGKIFELLTDPAAHPLLDGSGMLQRAKGDPARLELGSEFGMGMRLGLPYTIKNRVVEFEEERLIAWRHALPHRWRYELLPTEDGGTEVTGTFDWSEVPGPVSSVFSLLGVPARNQKAIDRTLEQIERMVAESGSEESRETHR